MRKKRLAIILIIVAALLLIPLIAMLFTNEVKWDILDFAIAGALLFGTGLIGDFIIRNIRQRWQRIVLVVILLIILLFIWMHLAVGIFTLPFGGT
jgi:hypothetical protein